MKRFFLAVGCLLTAAISFGAEVPFGIQQQYKLIEKCIVTPNVKVFKSLFDPSFVNIDEKGQKTAYPAFMKQIDQLFAGAVSGTAKEKFLGAKVHGELVEVSFDQHFSLKTAKSTMTGHEVGIDTWKKFGGEWRLVKTVDTLFTVKNS